MLNNKIIKFINDKINYIKYLFLLRGKEIGFIIIFFIILFWNDRGFSKKVNFEKTLAPNVLWRIFAIFIYAPLWYQYAYSCFMFYFERILPLSSKTASFYQITTSIIDFFIFSDQIELFFDGRYSFITLYQFFLYIICRLIVRFVPTKVIYLPMYIRYHAMASSILIILLDLIDEAYRLITGIVPDVSIEYFEITTKDDNFAMNCSFFMFFFYVAVIGNYTWKALKGISFEYKKGIIEILIRTHMSIDSLYEDEEWKDFGMDDRDDFQDY